jgi:predicted anti-sigma-YlaC factor YlaD
MEEQMTCKELVELVTEYLEGTLSQEVGLRLEEHLAGCSGCTAYLEQMRRTIRLTGQLREDDLTPQQRDDLLALFRGWKKK